MFELRLRSLEAGPSSYLGVVEGIPDILVHPATPGEAEGDLVRALIDHLESGMDYESTRLQLEDMPTVRVVQLNIHPHMG